MKNLAKIKIYIKAILVSKTMDDTLPMDMTELDIDELFDLAEACIKAEEFLCADEASIVEQVRAIQETFYEYPSKMIDRIDDVCPIEKFEFLFTTRDFLVQIGLID